MATRAMQHTDAWQRRFAALIEADYDYTRPRRGEVREATILSIGENDNSHLVSVRRGFQGNRLWETKAELVGRTLSLTVIDVNQRRRRRLKADWARYANWAIAQ